MTTRSMGRHHRVAPSRKHSLQDPGPRGPRGLVRARGVFPGDRGSALGSGHDLTIGFDEALGELFLTDQIEPRSGHRHLLHTRGPSDRSTGLGGATRGIPGSPGWPVSQDRPNPRMNEQVNSCCMVRGPMGPVSADARARNGRRGRHSHSRMSGSAGRRWPMSTIGPFLFNHSGIRSRLRRSAPVSGLMDTAHGRPAAPPTDWPDQLCSASASASTPRDTRTEMP